MSETQAAVDRVEYVKNGRAKFFDDPVNDQLLAMVMALLGEVCVLRDRLDAHERLASQKGLWSPQEVNDFQPDEQARSARQREREATLARVLKVLNEEVVRLRYE